jgi:hypothetical protein
MGEAEHGRVGDTVDLIVERLVDQRVAVPVHVAPQRRDAVDVATAVGVDQVGALGAGDHQGSLGAPVALLGERVPEVAMVELADGRRGRTR